MSEWQRLVLLGLLTVAVLVLLVALSGPWGFR